MHINHLGFNVGKGNFGDCINRLFWESLCEKRFIISYDPNKTHHYMTTGSVLEWATNKSIIFGTGFISANSDLGGRKWNSKTNKRHTTPHSICSVRGKLTRDKLIKMGVPCPESYGDPLLLFPAFYNPKPPSTTYNTIGIIPHYNDRDSDGLINLKTTLTNAGYSFKDINILTFNNYRKFINDIICSDIIISSSLHGVMMGLLYNKKTIFAKLSDAVDGGTFKFDDFFSSLSIEYDHRISNKNLLDNAIPLDKEKLFEVQHKMILSCPLFSKNIKDKLLTRMSPKFTI